MRPIALSVAFALSVVASVTFADDGAITTRAQAVQAMTEIGAQADEQTARFQRLAGEAQQLSTLYAGLDAKATALRQAAASCAKGCSDRAQTQLLAATSDMQQAQMSFNLQYLQLQSQMQNENRQYAAVSSILKAKHDSVKNSISNIR
ncbi:MAG TPA: hypothetical protein VMI75_36225 [Polyangiaceae bacterium]|nr:hypothetical protein [Polyangiaceae bacterium]